MSDHKQWGLQVAKGEGDKVRDDDSLGTLISTRYKSTVTLPQAADLLLRWFKYELNDKTVRSETQKFLEACGKIKPLGEALAEMRANGEKPNSQSGIEA